MNLKKLSGALLCLGLVFCSARSSAQTVTGYMGYSVGTGATAVELSDSLYLGPGLYEIDGTWEIYSSYVIIDPTATFTGAGDVVILNPGLWTGTSSPTYIDGNHITSAIDINIIHQNDQGIRLTELPFPADVLAFGWTENSSSGSLYVGRNTDLATDGAHIVLGTGVTADLIFDADATISNYRPSRYVITNNSILSHVVKENYTSAFTFPVGIASGDYTPARVSNASSNTISVSVQNYAASASLEALTDGTTLADGMNRTWHIYAGTAGISSTVSLQHNSITNQSGFNDAAQFVTQWGTTTPNTTGDFTIAFSNSSWQTNTPAAGAAGSLSSTGAVAGATLSTRNYTSGLAVSTGANESYFSKSSDVIHPLPLELQQFNAKANACKVDLSWKTGVEDNIESYMIQHSTDGSYFSTIASIPAGGKEDAYTYTHTAPANGLNIYRLRLLQRSGDYTTSPVTKIMVECLTGDNTVKAFPNPTEGELTLDGLFDKGSASDVILIRVVNIFGQVVFEQKATHNKERIDLKELAHANYMVQVLYNNEIRTQIKLIKL